MSQPDQEQVSGSALSADTPLEDGPLSPEEDETFAPEAEDLDADVISAQPDETELFDEAHEQRDLHDYDDIGWDLPDTGEPDIDARLPRGKIVKELRGAGKVFDYRGTGLLPANGGLIRPRIMVEHIPVVRNVPGTADFRTLARVLRQQGLAVQAATDAEGNVALYTNLDRLCHHARGANQVSCGVEHMHWSISEDWTRRQLCAAAWLWQYAERAHGIPLRIARISAGRPVRVVKAGHTSHRRVSEAAGYKDRSDPGPMFDWQYVRRAALFFKKRGHFVGV